MIEAVNQIPPFSAVVMHAEVVDGDTIRVGLDRGFNDYKTIDCRLRGIDTPERNTAAGQLVSGVVEQWLRGVGRKATVSHAKDKFSGRYIGEVYHVNDSGYVQDSLGGYLRRIGLCREYDGGKRAEWGDEELGRMEAKARTILAGMDE